MKVIFNVGQRLRPLTSMPPVGGATGPQVHRAAVQQYSNLSL